MREQKKQRNELDWAKDGLRNIWDKCLTLGSEFQFVGADERFAQEAVDALYQSTNPSDHLLANATVGRFNQRGMSLERRVGMPLRPFAIDDDKPFWGYDSGARWNGWAEPLVTIEVLRQLATDPASPFNEEMALKYQQGYWLEIPEPILDEDGNEVPPVVKVWSVYEDERDSHDLEPISQSGYGGNLSSDLKLYDVGYGYVWSWWSTAEILAESIIRSVAEDEELSRCKSFAELHQICDANLLGDLTDYDPGNELEAETMNEAIEIFDSWAGSDDRRPPYDLTREED